MASVWGELQRRNVVRVAIAYAVVAWLVLQIADTVLDNISAPAWVFQTILLLLVIGFPVALVFAWAFVVFLYWQVFSALQVLHPPVFPLRPGQASGSLGQGVAQKGFLPALTP